jgi:FkbM family methyltransferase
VTKLADTVTIIKSIPAAGTLAAKSVELDLALMRINALPLQWRVRFLLKKYKTLLRLRSGRPAKFAIKPLSLLIRNISGFGTLQSSIIDFFDDVVSPGVLGPAPLIVDVGANVGQFANAAKLFFPEARVVSFEPDPETYADLQINTHGRRDVELHNVGLGDRDEVMMFYRHELSVMSSFSAQTDEMAHHRGSTELPVRRLDAVLGPDVRPDLLKIDVEGSERQVLQGAWETVARSRYVLIELSLGRPDGAGNLRLLRDIVAHAPSAAIIRFGRPLGGTHRPMCQDVLIAVEGAPHTASPAVSLERVGAGVGQGIVTPISSES